MKRIILLVILLTCVLFSQAQKITTIQDIKKKPYDYKLEFVQVEGYVEQYIVDNNETTDYYILKGDFGDQIRIYTSSGTPEVLKRLRVTGTVIYDDQVGKLAITEAGRVLLDGAGASAGYDAAAQEAVSAQSGDETKKDKDDDDKKSRHKSSDDNLLLYILIGAGIIVLALIVILLVLSGRKKSKAEAAPQDKPDGAILAGPPADSNQFQTIKISTATPKTMKFIPGELKITSGEDEGKSFKIAGYPTPAGNIVSIGREEIKGERAFSHIMLKQKTISRKQAEIISKEGKLFVRNLSETNYTQVDGVELQPGEQVELKPNSTIRTGEIEFKYIV